MNGGARLRRALISQGQRFGLDGISLRQIPGKPPGRPILRYRRHVGTGKSEKMISFLPSCDKRKEMKSLVLASALLFSATAASRAAEDWRPAQGRLMTRWARDVSPKNAHPEYPRPQMVRKEWQNLNGLWDYAITEQKPEAGSQKPEHWDGQILVPFPVESALSGVMRRVYETNRLWYRRTFTIPRGWSGKRVLLHFGAADWETTVWVNGKETGKHQGGYDAFTFDITEALKAKDENEIMVSVWDPTDAGPQPRGKQVRKPGGIWYTPTSGIWQTVWLEPLSGESWIDWLKLVPNNDLSGIEIIANVSGVVGDGIVDAVAYDGTNEVGRASGTDTPSFSLGIADAKRWSPE